jgi:hypothetical protein
LTAAKWRVDGREMGRAEIGHWSCSAWSVDVRVNPLDPPCGARFGGPQAGISGRGGPTRVQVRSTLPKPVGVVGKPASIGDGVSHRGELMAASFAFLCARSRTGGLKCLERLRVNATGNGRSQGVCRLTLQ